MAPSDPQLERAKQGDPEAIAALMRKSLQPKGIDVQAETEGDLLLVTLEGDKPVNRSAIVEFIRKGMSQLDVPSLRSVQVDWRKPGSLLTEWTEDIPLREPAEPGFSPSSFSQADVPMVDDRDLPDEGAVGDLDEGDGAGGYDAGDYDADDYAVGEDGDGIGDEAAEDAAAGDRPARKKTSPLVLVLILLAAIAALGWLYLRYLRGELDPAIARLPAPIQSLLPPRSGEAAVEEPAEGEMAEGEMAEGEAPAEGEATAGTETPAEGEAAPGTEAPAEGEEAAAGTETPAEEAPAAEEEAPAEEGETAATPPAAGDLPEDDVYVQALRFATQAANDTQVAQSPQAWQSVAANWEQAIALLEEIPEDHPEYEGAQERLPQYQNALEYARQNAQRQQ